MGTEKLPWEMDAGEFFEFSQKGRLHEDTHEPAPYRVGTQETALSLGESERYSYEDIAFFYVARNMPLAIKNTWPREAKKFGWLAENMDRIELAHYEFIKDALFEGKSVPSKVLAEYPDLKAKFETKSHLG